MKDEDLPDYAWLHCRTERALFHTSHLRRLFEIAGEPIPGDLRHDGFISAFADVLDPIITKAKARLIGDPMNASATTMPH
jgi:hypothetical protein